MAKKKKLKKRSKKGLNLIKAFPIEFSENILSIRHSGQTDNFSFSFPAKKLNTL
jgi:hypothetical protein